jgi:hypothetical protein
MFSATSPIQFPSGFLTLRGSLSFTTTRTLLPHSTQSLPAPLEPSPPTIDAFPFLHPESIKFPASASQLLPSLPPMLPSAPCFPTQPTPVVATTQSTVSVALQCAAIVIAFVLTPPHPLMNGLSLLLTLDCGLVMICPLVIV